MLEQTKEYFKHKNWNEETLYYIDNFINEFNTLFSEYVSKEELLKRIDENLIDNIEFVKQFEDKRVLGKYNNFLKKIFILEPLDDKMKKSVIFHEMIHVTTELGKTKPYIIDNLLDDDEFDVIFQNGVVEGFTQYVTELRNNYYRERNKSNSYPLLTKITKFLAENVIGKEKYLNLAFNYPNEIENEFLNYEEFAYRMDEIWKYEDEFYQEQHSILWFLGKFNNSNTINSINCVGNQLVTMCLENPINSIKDLNEVYKKIKYFEKSTGYRLELDIFEIIIEKIENINLTKEELNNLDEEIKQEYIWNKKIEKKLCTNEKNILKSVISNDFDDIGIIDSKFYYAYLKKIVERCLGEGKANNIDVVDMLLLLEKGFAKMLLENNINPKILAYEHLNFGSDTIFNLYDTLNNKYIGTYEFYNDLFCKFDVQKEKKFESSVLEDEFGRKIIKDKNNKYILIDEEGDKISCKNIQYNSSDLEILERRLQFFRESYEKHLSLDLENEFEKNYMLYYLERIQNIKAESITPENIEKVTMDCTYEEIEDSINEITSSVRDIDEMYRKGVEVDGR